MLLRCAIFGTALLAFTPAMAAAGERAALPRLHQTALGDLAPYKALADATLTLAAQGDISGAQKRGTDLETAWDEAEDKLKPTDPARWRVIDKAIDRVLAALRATQPQQPMITAALKDLLGTIDKGGAA